MFVVTRDPRVPTLGGKPEFPPSPPTITPFPSFSVIDSPRLANGWMDTRFSSFCLHFEAFPSRRFPGSVSNGEETTRSFPGSTNSQSWIRRRRVCPCKINQAQLCVKNMPISGSLRNIVAPENLQNSFQLKRTCARLRKPPPGAWTFLPPLSSATLNDSTFATL